MTIVVPGTDVAPGGAVDANGTVGLQDGVLRRRWTARPADWTDRTRRNVGLVVGFVAIVVAYRTTLTTLVESMQIDTPLAHLSLVPIISLCLAWAMRSRPVGPDICDRQLDWIVGAPLIVVALFMNRTLPAELSWEFWIWRVDLLSFPLFVAGVVSLLFGVRIVWKYRLPIAFLFLAWPYPYSLALDRWLGRFTDLTIDGLALVLGPVPLATRVAGSESLFEVVHAGVPVRMSVASACSGANGLVGFLLVGAAFMLVVQGSGRAKVAWLGAGAVLVWLFNLVRIMSIFVATRWWGEDIAIDGFHPYVGLVVFNISVVIMLTTLRRFGLRFGSNGTVDGVTGGTVRVARPAAVRRSLSVPERPVFAAFAVGVAALSIGSVNVDLHHYDRVASSLGSARLAPFESSLEHPAGWQVRQTDTYDWSQRFFGPDSEWTRYSYSVDRSFDGERIVDANLPITADVISTSNRASLSSYGVEQCYSFHGHDLSEVAEVDLGSGLYGGMLTWTNVKKNLTWTSLYWHWPVRVGADTRYERITLIMQDRPGNEFVAPPLEDGLPDDIETADADSKQRLERQREFLVGFARRLVDQRAAANA